MNSAEHRTSFKPLRAGSAPTSPLSAVRSQAAFVRALLDELERLAPAGGDSEVSSQVVEELARLGCTCLDVARGLATAERVADVPGEFTRCA